MLSVKLSIKNFEGDIIGVVKKMWSTNLAHSVEVCGISLNKYVFIVFLH